MKTIAFLDGNSIEYLLENIKAEIKELAIKNKPLSI
jgi:hypothetical protein